MVLNNEKLEPRDSIAIDIASMPVSPHGKNGFLLIVDQATKFVSVALLSSAKAEFLHDGLWDKWFSIFGIPSKLQSDQGQNVDGNVIRKLCENLEIKKPVHCPTTLRGMGLLKELLAQ